MFIPRFHRIIVIFWFLFVSSTASGWPSSDKIKALLPEDINAGIYLKDLSDGSVFSYHGTRMFYPASIVKLFTTYSALTYLGSEYKFKTVLAIKKNDLYIKFSGDPSLTYADLKEMLGKINTVRNVVVDGTIFDENYSAPGGFTWDDHRFYYAAPKSAIIINKNCSEAKMMPASRAGKKAKLIIEEPKLLNIENNVLTVAPRKQECPYKSRYIGENRYEVYGCMFQNMQEPVRLTFALQDNNLMIQNYIKKAFGDLNIKFTGQIKFGKASFSDKNIVFTHESLPLKDLIKEILAHSCNVYAGSLFKHVTAKYTGNTASDEDGEEVFKQLLKQSGLKGKFVIKDGAGESRYNLITPQTAVEMLEIIYKNKKIKDLFLESLAQHGSKGTLRTRTIGAAYDKYIYGKTGYDSRTSALAGYYLPENGHQYAFAIIINNHNMPWEQVKILEDKILYEILENTKNPS